MTKNDIIIPAVFGLTLVVIYLGFLILVPRPSLTIKINGIPVAALTSKDIISSKPVTVKSGVITPAETGNIPDSMLVHLPSGEGRMVRFPEKGNKAIDIRGRLTVTTTTLEYGIYRQTNSTEMYAYSNEEVRLIENGTMTSEKVNQRIQEGN